MTSSIVVDGVSKRFRLYHDRNQSLKAAVMRGRRASYEDFWALRDVSLEIPRGATFGLIGANGSGKSTLLKCIARILRPDEGSVTVHGSMSALLELGAGFHPELSGRENVYLNGSILGMPRVEIDRRFDEIVSFAGLERFIDNPVKNYSSGMYVRLGFSVAISVEPEVLLVDEVLAVGDEQFQRRCSEKFAELRARGTTIVVVSHALASVRTMCDEVAWFKDGRVLDVGRASDLIDAYLTATHEDREAPDAVHDSPAEVAAAHPVRIRSVQLLDADGQPTTQVFTGAPLRVRAEISSVAPTDVVVGFDVHTVEGVHLAGPTSRSSGQPLKVDGTCEVELEIDHVTLLTGTYDLTPYVTDTAGLVTYDRHMHEVRFDVAPSATARGAGGLVDLGGTWAQRPGAAEGSASG